MTAVSEPRHERCITCEQRFELAEFVACPFYRGPICSVCCASEKSCGELFKSPEGLRAGEPHSSRVPQPACGRPERSVSLLVTGFGPFADQTDNPSRLLARALHGERIAGENVTGVVLPVSGGQAGQELTAVIDGLRPRLVLALGVTPGRSAPALERVAINVRDFPIPDIDGAQPIDEPVVVDGPDAYLAALPIKAILVAWQSAGLPGYVSNTAGTYVCNQVFYLAAHRARQDGFRAGLIHLPALPTPTTATMPGPSMSLDLMEQAVRIALTVVAGHTGPDLPLAAGAVG